MPSTRTMTLRALAFAGGVMTFAALPMMAGTDTNDGRYQLAQATGGSGGTGGTDQGAGTTRSDQGPRALQNTPGATGPGTTGTLQQGTSGVIVNPSTDPTLQTRNPASSPGNSAGSNSGNGTAGSGAGGTGAPGTR